METRRLAVFLAVVDEGGFTAAADVLEVSQPAVSQAVRELEVDLGVALFHRLGRGVALTPAGEALVTPARQALRDLEIGRAAAAAVAGLKAGRLDLACLPTLAVAPLAPLVGAFRSAYPGVSVRLSDPAGTAELLQFVRSGRSEVGLVDEPGVEDLVSIPLASQDFLVVLPPGSAAPNELPLRELAGWPLVATPAGTSTRGLLDEALGRVAGAPQIAVEAAQREALLPLIVAGAGASLLPRPLAEVAEVLGCVAAEPAPAVTRTVTLVHRRGPLTPAAAAFVELALGRHGGR
jgi:DNA-binding transcriptional LysR family regulator